MKVTSRHILDRLTSAYGPVTWVPRFEPLDELIFTVLTQHTSDLNAERAYKVMRARYPHWDDVMDASPAELAEAIRSGGLANQKSVRIKQILQMIKERQGDFDLRFLAELPLAEAKAWLMDLPGVGPKTAAVTLSFALGMPAMPVDTHIFRVAKRLGLIRSKTTVEDAHPILERLVDPADVFRFHVLLIRHGRRICKARSPDCPGCALNDRCPSRSLFYPAGNSGPAPVARRTRRRAVRGTGRPA